MYVIGEEGGDHVKIGKSVKPKQRLKSLSTGTPRELELVTKAEVENASEVEQTLHQKYDEYRVTGEWFKASDDIRMEIVNDVKKQEEKGSVGIGRPAGGPKDQETIKKFYELWNDLRATNTSENDFQGMSHYTEGLVGYCDLCGRHGEADALLESDGFLHCYLCYEVYALWENPEKATDLLVHEARRKSIENSDKYNVVSSIAEISRFDFVYLTNPLYLDETRLTVLSAGPEYITIADGDLMQMLKGPDKVESKTFRLTEKPPGKDDSFLEILRCGRMVRRSSGYTEGLWDHYKAMCSECGEDPCVCDESEPSLPEFV